jgi:hypothetical protein
MVLRRVSLSASTPLPAGKLEEVKGMILANYGKFKGGLSHDGDSIWGKVGDSRGTIVSVDIGRAGGMISWTSRYFDALLDEEYEKRMGR